MSDSFPDLSVDDLLNALTRAQEAAYIWTVRDDRIRWAADAALALRAPKLARCTTGAELRDLFCAGDEDRRDFWVAETARRNAYVGAHRVGTVDDGQWFEERLVRLEDTAAEGTRFLGFLRNISEQRAEMEKLAYLARFDELTGHLSRAHLRTSLAQRLAEAQRSQASICYGLIGLDNMAGVNSAFGYDVADVVLVTIGQEISKRLSPGDVMGRIGSSKFGIVFCDCSPDELVDRLSAVQAIIRDTVIETGAGPVAVTISASGVVLPDHATTTQDAFAAVEDALTRAKESGVDHVLIHTPDETVETRRRDNITLADDVVAAVREDRLKLAYQPIVDVNDTTRVAFHECLLRLIDRSGAFVNAGTFMPVAEKLGLVRMLDKRVLGMAFETLRSHARVRLSVNLSPQSLRDSSWLALFEELAKANPSAPERMIVEVTEATAIDDAETMLATLNRIREWGCAIALDDFGAGYTSFQQLKSLKFDIVKIDGSYVRGVLDSRDDQLFVRVLSELAKNYDMMVVAEMVENSEAGELLRTLGVDTLQGYHFGMPDVEPDWLNGGDAERIEIAS